MQKHADVVQNLNGNVVVGAVVQVMVAGTSTPATIFADAAGLAPLAALHTDSLGEFGFYAPNGRYDLYIITNGVRVAHDTDVLLYDPEDDARVTGGGSGGGAGGGGGGSGNGLSPEIDLVAAADGSVTLDYAQGNNFHVLMTGNVKLMNPVNYPSGVDITVTLEQDTTGGRTIGFDTQYAPPNALPIGLASAPHGLNLLMLHHTSAGGGLWLAESRPDKSLSAGYGPVTAIARIGSVTYFTMGDTTGAMTAAQDGQTIVVLRNGKSHEVTGAITGTDPAQTFRVYGAPVTVNGTDQRPILQLYPYDYGEGPPRGANRPAFGKALLNFEGKGTAYVRDLRITGARNDDGDARGICNNSDGMSLVVNNVEITDCNNGIENGNQTMTGNTTLTDVLIDKCGVGGPDVNNSHGTGSSAGFTHSVYMGHNNCTIRMTRVSLTNAVDGNNLKCRTGTLIIDQVLCSGAANGRELELPNGGTVIATNSSFIKPASSNNGSMVLLGGNGGVQGSTEGLDTSRPRKYKFVNCLFHSDYSISGQYAGRDGYLVCNLDPDVPLEFVDCKFEGELATSNSGDPNQKPIYAGTVTQNGIRYMPSAPPIFTLTGGPLGPILPPGYQPVAMTPVA